MTNQYVNHDHAPIRRLGDELETRIATALEGASGSKLMKP